MIRSDLISSDRGAVSVCSGTFKLERCQSLADTDGARSTFVYGHGHPKIFSERFSRKLWMMGDRNITGVSRSSSIQGNGPRKKQDHIIRIIGKIVLDEDHHKILRKLNVSLIADSNPNRNDKDEIRNRIGNASIVLNNISTPITGDIIRDCPNLRFIQTWSTGTDNIDLQAAQECGVRVANVPDFSTEAVAEKTIGLMLLAANRLHEAHDHAVRGGWEYQKFVGIELRGKTLCLVGNGRIGKRVAKIAGVFGMKVVVIDSKSTQKQFDNAISMADFISLHCPLTPQTVHLLGRKQFELMKGVILINNSRGGIIDEQALLVALNEGSVSYATMDVFEHEPPQKSNPLLKHPQVYVTPHCTWNTRESIKNLTNATLRNIQEFIDGTLQIFVV